MVVAQNNDNDNIVSLTTLLKSLIGHIELQEIELKKIFPTGSIMLFGGSKAPPSWLLCDGSVVLRDNHKELFEVIGETYGKGDGHNTFSLPDLRGRIAIGAGEAAGLTTRLLGQTTGSENYTLTIAQLPNHAHSGTTSSAENHAHSGTTQVAGNHSHSGTTARANPKFYRTVHGANNISFANHQPGIGHYGNHDRNDGEFCNADHTHNFGTNAAGDHAHGFSTGDAGGHQHTISAEGEGQPYSVMQPSLSLNYIIKY